MRSDFSCFSVIFRQTLLRARRSGLSAWQPFCFFILVVLLFPLATDASRETMHLLAPAAFWVGVVLSQLLAITQGFVLEHEEGTLELWMTALHPLPWVLLAKQSAQWLVATVPLIVALPFFALFFDLSVYSAWLLLVTLLFGTPALYGLASIFSALLVGFRQSAWLMALLVLPLLVPVVIFGCGVLQAAAAGQSIITPLSVMGILSLIVCVIFPFLSAAALRVGVQQA